MKTPIMDMLKKNAADEHVSFHMPGHKGINSFIDSSFIKYDITELSYSDNLYCPSGTILESEEYAGPGALFG